MQVELRCAFCSRKIRVDSSLAGGRCRCKHCGEVNNVPLESSMPELPRTKAPGKRPKVAPDKAAPSGIMAEIGRLMRVRYVPGISILVGCGLAVFIWAWLTLTPGDSIPTEIPRIDPPPPRISDPLVAMVPPTETLVTLPKTFCDIPLSGSRSAWIVDGGARMVPYYNDMTTLIATAMRLLSSGQQAGLVLASAAGDCDTLPMREALEPAVNTAREVMRRFKPAGEAELVKAFRVALEWKPDAAYLVLAQPTRDAVREEIVRLARANGLPVSVIALGEERYLGWAVLAHATGGDFIAMDVRELQIRTARLFPPERHPTPITPPRLHRPGDG